MPHYGRIAGQVLDYEGTPIEEAVIAIVGGPSHPDLAALSDADGRYALDGLDAGDYRVRVHAPGEEPQEDCAHVEAGRSTRLDFTIGVDMVHEAWSEPIP